MDDTKTLSIPAPDGTKLRARPLTENQLLSFSLLRGAEPVLAIEIVSELFKSAFGPETFREFAVRMAQGDATASLKTMIELLSGVVQATQAAAPDSADVEA